MELTQVKHEIETLAEKYRNEFETVSAYIFAHPELAYHETLAQDQLCGLLEKHGFKVQRGAGSHGVENTSGQRGAGDAAADCRL